MKKAKRLFDHLNNENVGFKKIFPKSFDGTDQSELHILYLACMNDVTSIYRTINPAIELNESGYSVVLHNFLRKNGGQLYLENYNIGVERYFQEWADYIIFPPSTEMLDFIIKDIRSLNPRVKICMDVDRNYHNIPKMSYDYTYYNPQRREKMVRNMGKMDMILVPDEQVMQFYDKEIKKITGKTARFSILPNMISDSQLEFVRDYASTNKPKERRQSKDDTFKILLYSDYLDYEDVNANRDILEKFQKKYPQTHVILYGDNLNWKSRNALRGIDYKHVKQKSIFNYLTDLKKIDADLAFIPVLHRNEYYRTNYKFLDLSALGIPILAYNIEPYNKYPDVLFLGEKKKHIQEILEDVIANRDKLIDMGIKAQDFVFDRLSYNKRSLNYIDNIFFGNTGIPQNIQHESHSSNDQSYNESVEFSNVVQSKNQNESIQFEEVGDSGFQESINFTDAPADQ